MNIQGISALVTGGGSGLGEASARELARLGAKVAVLDLNLENAQKVATLLGDSCQKNWLLVTSASHMPRSMEEFNAVGCHVTPYPVDFQTSSTTAWTEYSLASSLMRWQVALNEWLGLAVYAFTR